MNVYKITCLEINRITSAQAFSDLVHSFVWKGTKVCIQLGNSACLLTSMPIKKIKVADSVATEKWASHRTMEPS